MRVWLIGVVIGVGCSFSGLHAKAQAAELEELALDIQKLAQYKTILADLKKEYQIISLGYTGIRDIAKGQFNLHKAFLDGLLAVSPAVQKYKRIGDIISLESRLVSEADNAIKGFRAGGLFSTSELETLADVYSNLLGMSLKNISDLATIITANKLRMSDDERIKGIDRIYFDMEDKMSFLRSYDNETSVLGLQRAREQQGVQTLEIFSGNK